MRPLFNPAALYAALDAQRKARGMTWNEVSRDIGVSIAAMRELEDKDALEADGVLQMTRWLGLPIESFVGSGRSAGPGPDPGDFRSTGLVLRFDNKALYDAVDARRRKDGLTWQQASEAIGARRATVDMLLGLRKSSRIELYTMLAIVGWLGERSSRFTRLSPS